MRQGLHLRQPGSVDRGVVDRRAAEQEELQLRRGHVPKADLLSTLQLAAEHGTRVAGERLTIGRVHVADHLGGGVVAAFPGDDAEGFQLGIEKHVRLVDAAKPPTLEPPNHCP